MSNLLELPTELVLECISWSTVQDASRVGRTCKKLQHLVTESSEELHWKISKAQGYLDKQTCGSATSVEPTSFNDDQEAVALLCDEQGLLQGREAVASFNKGSLSNWTDFEYEVLGEMVQAAS
ncbi:hypothetical protein OIO90_000296 [Microbotryomycetes sp. JL221]|nr:hypothetical protein OIO90_000296 [Microbotryomycetes sp. JL221]